MNSSRQFEQDKKWLLAAIELSKKCTPPLIYSVGCVIVDSQNRELAAGYTGEISYDGSAGSSVPHAEEIALSRLPRGISCINLTLYSTLEPCSERRSGFESCASRIIKSGISRVVFGAHEPFDERLNIRCQGEKHLRDSGAEVLQLQELEAACLAAVKRADANLSSTVQK